VEDDENRLLTALSKITERGIAMEWVLRPAFCCLVSSKYAAVVAGGQSSSWLIDQCDALARINREMTEEGRKAQRVAPLACRSASQQRDTLIRARRLRWPMVGSLRR
jgi:hypothetical protein